MVTSVEAIVTIGIVAASAGVWLLFRHADVCNDKAEEQRDLMRAALACREPHNLRLHSLFKAVPFSAHVRCVSSWGGDWRSLYHPDVVAVYDKFMAGEGGK